MSGVKMCLNLKINKIHITDIEIENLKGQSGQEQKIV